MSTLEANQGYLIYFDNVRVDEFVKSWNVELNCNGNIGTANIEFIYLPQLAYTAAYVKDIEKSESIIKMLGVIDNMTNVKIFVKNIFSGKYQLVFDGNIKGKASSRSPQSNSLSFNAVDYTAWTNRTVAPMVIPYTQRTHPSDKFIWEAQGINFDKVMSVSQRDIVAFKGRRLEEIINTVVTQALAANSIYSDRRGVGYWDGIWDRMDLMADIDPDILHKNVLDYIISPNQGNVDTMYVLLNDIFTKIMFEFYQDRDGIIRIKPPFWNQPVLKSHIIDPTLILSMSENTDYDNFVSRAIVTGGLDENFQTAGDFMTKLWTPTGCLLSDGRWETTQAVAGFNPGDIFGTGAGGASGGGGGGNGTDAENDVSGGGGSGKETADFDRKHTNKGNVYKRLNGDPIVGFGDPNQYGSTKGNGVWWPSVGDGVRAHVQHLCSYYRKKLISGNKCVDPRFGNNGKTTSTVSGLTGTWASNPRYARNIMALINKMLGTNASNAEIGTSSKATYNQRVTPEHKKRIKDYFVRAVEGRGAKLTGGVSPSRFIDHYFEKCAEELIYPEVAIAQMCEETGHLTFKGSAVYQQNNYAGIGSTDGGNYTTAKDWYWPKGGATKTVKGKTTEYKPTTTSFDNVKPDSIKRASDSSSSSSRSSSSGGGKKPKYIIVDAGHGAGDSGCVSSDGLKEKDVTLALERMVVQILNNNGIQAYHSRTDDKEIGSVRSGRRQAKLKSDIQSRGHNRNDYCLISIHVDSAGSSAKGYHVISNGGAKSNQFADIVRRHYSRHVDHYFWEVGTKDTNRKKNNYNGGLGMIKESDWPCGACLIETFFMSNPKERSLWDKKDFAKDAAAGIAAGIAEFMNKTITDTSVNGDLGATDVSDGEKNQWGSANPNAYNGSIFGKEYDWKSVDFSKIREATHEELRYGGSIRQVDQPLIKFSNATAFYEMGAENADATEVLKQYAQVYMNMNNSLVNTSVLTMHGAPWLRPGFNVWVDPIYTDKIFYVTSISHSGSASGGVFTTLRLIHGRHRSEFLEKKKDNNFGVLSKEDDNIFTKNEFFKSAKDFGPVIDTKEKFDAEKKNLINIMSSLDQKGIVKAERSPYAPYYASDYGDSFLKTPTILRYNDLGIELFSETEWKEITGRTEVVNTMKQDNGGGASNEEGINGGNGNSSSNSSSASKSSNSSSTKSASRATSSSNPGDLKRGDRGDDVRRLQTWLNRLDRAGIAEDGIFGTATENAVRNYQRKRGLTVTGIYDYPTGVRLNQDAVAWNNGGSGGSSKPARVFVNNTLLKYGKKGAKVKELQGYLNEFCDRGIITGLAKLPVTGNYLHLTKAMVTKYQTIRKIRIDGIVGPETTATINKDLKAIDSSNGGGGGAVIPPNANDGGTAGNNNANGKPGNTNPADEKSKAKGRVTNVLFTGQYTPEEIGAAITDLYKNYAPGVVRQRSYVIEKGMNDARKLSNTMYVNNNYNKGR